MTGEHRPETEPKSPGELRGYGSLGKYQLFARLGSGGQADVYLAVSRGPMRFDKLVVLKCLKFDVAHQSELVTMFLDEARLAARLNHPNVVQTFEVDQDRGVYFIAMEYLEGQPLSRVLRAPGIRESVTHPMWAYLVAEALTGLHYAHELCDYDGTPLGIVHRDLSPHNLFVGYDGTVKLVDFGIAKASLNATRTETGVVKGKASYMAPEQAYGAEVDRRADIFAMGIVLWEAVTGKRLFEGEPLTILNRLVHEPIPRASSVCKVAPELDAVIARALEKKPEDRYPTAEAMHEALDAYAAASGGVVRGPLVAKVMTTTFQELRDSVQAQVQAHMANAVAIPSEMRVRAPPLLLGEAGDIPEISGLGTPSHVQARMQAVEAPVSTVPPADSRGDRPARARRVALAVIAVAGVAAVGFALRRPPRSPALAPPSPAAAPGAATPESPASIAPVAPPAEIVTVVLTSEPSAAMVRRGGLALGRTPMRVELPRKIEVLTLSLDGYEEETLVLDLDASPAGGVVQRDVELRPLAHSSPAPHPHPGSKGPSPVPSSSAPPGTRSIDPENPFEK
ncbi:MAG TPA: serine/threonine-protein kinase [Polyangiaceae bacterium]|jgi:serine/threonine-protein kinase